MGLGSVQLFRPGHRQHGSAASLRHARTEGQMARAAAGRRNPLGVPDDRAGGRLFRCHQYRDDDRRATATTMCINGRKWWSSGVGDPRCKIAIVMGKTDPAAPATSSNRMILDSARHAGREGACACCRCSATTMRPHGHAEVASGKRARAGGQSPARRGPRLRNRAGPARSRADSSLHAHDRRGRGRAGKNDQAASVPRRVRQEARRAFGVGAAHRRGAHRHRDDAGFSASRRPT